MDKKYLYTLKEVIFSFRMAYLTEKQNFDLPRQSQNIEERSKNSLSFHPSSIQVKSLSDNGIITFNNDNISVSSINNSGLPELLYSPLSDSLTLTESNPDLKVTKYAMDFLMSMMFFSEHFSPYHLTLLQSSPFKEKKLVLEKFDPSPKIKLYINEDEDCIRLIKSPKKGC